MHQLLDLLAAGSAGADEALRDKMREQIIVQLLAAQTVAHAAYTAVAIGDLNQARTLVRQVAQLQGDLRRPLDEGLTDAAALRVCALLNIDP